ncbi:hypothetical protein HKX41_10945, partial [Salinisphaera sp. USBA-960]|nr:hypothetical protein [Salifodinibacter halophilus]
MSPATVRVAPLSRRCASTFAALTLAVAAVPAAQAAEPGTTTHTDPSVIVARTVYPRIAYRALPAQDNP